VGGRFLTGKFGVTPYSRLVEIVTACNRYSAVIDAAPERQFKYIEKEIRAS